MNSTSQKTHKIACTIIVFLQVLILQGRTGVVFQCSLHLNACNVSVKLPKLMKLKVCYFDQYFFYDV